MVRLTHDLVVRAPQSLNPLKERELLLRGHKIPAIENLGVCEDGYDTIDLSDNEVRRLDNFPRMKRLTTLFMNNNHIVRIGDLAEQLPNLEKLMLTGNKLNLLQELDPLGKMRKLDMLSLIGNPVVRQPHYRLYVIFTIPSLKTLDFRKIKAKDRREAERMFANKPKPTGDDRQPTSALSRSSDTQKLTSEQQTIIKLAISKAKTNEDVDRLERMLLQGVTPEQLENLKATVFGGDKATKSAPDATAMEVESPAPAPAPYAAPAVKEMPAPAPAPPPAPAPAPVEALQDAPAEDAVMEVEAAPEPAVQKILFNWSKLKVVDLKKEVAKRGLSKDGKKADLVARLTEDDPFNEKS